MENGLKSWNEVPEMELVISKGIKQKYILLPLYGIFSTCNLTFSVFFDNLNSCIEYFCMKSIIYVCQDLFTRALPSCYLFGYDNLRSNTCFPIRLPSALRKLTKWPDHFQSQVNHVNMAPKASVVTIRTCHVLFRSVTIELR